MAEQSRRQVGNKDRAKGSLVSPIAIFEMAQHIRLYPPRSPHLMSFRRRFRRRFRHRLRLPHSRHLARHVRHPAQVHLQVDAWIVVCDRRD
jgi:aromatic ring-cleaving dioxygenase